MNNVSYLNSLIYLFIYLIDSFCEIISEFSPNF